MKMVISTKKYELPEEEVRLLVDKCKKCKIEFRYEFGDGVEQGYNITVKEWFKKYEIKEGE